MISDRFMVYSLSIALSLTEDVSIWFFVTDAQRTSIFIQWFEWSKRDVGRLSNDNQNKVVGSSIDAITASEEFDSGILLVRGVRSYSERRLQPLFQRWTRNNVSFWYDPFTSDTIAFNAVFVIPLFSSLFSFWWSYPRTKFYYWLTQPIPSYAT